MTYRPADIDDLAGLRRVDLLRHARDRPAFDGDIPHGVDAVLRVDHMPALEQQVVARLRRRRPNQKDRIPSSLIVEIVYPPAKSTPGAEPALKQVLQAKLNQPRRHRGLRDHAETRGPEGRPGVGELRMIHGIVELHAEREFRAFAQSADRDRLPSEKSAFTCPGPFRMLWPALP